MRTKALLSFAFVLVTFFGISKSDPLYSVSPKAINLEEVKNSIKYPVSTKENTIEGKVLMYVEIDAEGNITNKTALAYPCKQLKAEVEKALADLKFEPAKDQNGMAVASSVRIPFNFELTID